MLRRYAFSDLVGARKPAAGLILNCAAPALVEIAALAGFDFVLIDCEHGPLDAGDVEAMVCAADAAGIAPLVRVQGPEAHLALRALDVGALGLVVPRIESAETARKALDSVFFPPVGRRGVAPSTRAAGYGVRVPFVDYLEMANRELFVMPIIETPAGVAAVDEILAMPEIKAIVVGPTDLAAAMGQRGNRDAPEVRAVVRHVLARAKEHGKAVALPGATQAMVEESLETEGALLLVPLGSWMIQQGRQFLVPIRVRQA